MSVRATTSAPSATSSPSDARFAPLLKGFARLAAGALVVVPCLVLTGWIFNIEALKRISPNLVAMNPLTAVNFILCGISLWFAASAEAGKGAGPLVQVTAAIVTVTALLKLAGIAFGFDLQLDQLLFRDKLDLDPVQPNRMAPTTAFNFALLGSALMLINFETRRHRWPAQILSLIIALIASLALVGYIYGVKSLTGLARYIPMALHTAALFVAASLGVLCARSTRGWMARATGNSPGGVMVRRVLPIVIGAPLVLGWLILTGQRTGSFGPEFAFSLFVIGVIAVVCALIWTNAVSLDRKELEREAADGALMQAHRELEHRVTERTADLSSVLKEIGHGVDVLGSSVTGILQSTTQVSASAGNTATALAETTVTIEEIRQTTQVSATHAQQVAEGAQGAARISDAGKRATEEVRNAVRRIQDQMESIAVSMTNLSEQTHKISGIIAAVEDLAQQSNILAVNAAIEAAKAGRHGKGFSVVAHEVKSLAEQSRASTAEVRSILKQIHQAVNAAAATTRQGSLAVEAGVAQASEASGSILTLADSVAQSAQVAMRIAASSREQLAGMDQVVTAMQHIKEASARNVESADQLDKAAKKLSELGSELGRLTGNYKL